MKIYFCIKILKFRTSDRTCNEEYKKSARAQKPYYFDKLQITFLNISIKDNTATYLRKFQRLKVVN